MNVYVSMFVIIFWLVFMAMLGWGPIKSWLFKPKFEVLNVEIIPNKERFGSPEMVFEAKNKTRWGAESVRFEFKLYDQDGIVVGEKTIYASNVYGGEQMKLRERYIEENAVSAKLMRVVVRNY